MRYHEIVWRMYGTFSPHIFHSSFCKVHRMRMMEENVFGNTEYVNRKSELLMLTGILQPLILVYVVQYSIPHGIPYPKVKHCSMPFILNILIKITFAQPPLFLIL